MPNFEETIIIKKWRENDNKLAKIVIIIMIVILQQYNFWL